jgi:ATP-binding cassette, subfamily B, bacterial MsbA
MLIPRILRAGTKLGLGAPSIAGLLGLQLAGTVFESIGLAILLPVIQFVQAHGNTDALASKSGLWHHIVDVYGAVGLKVTLPVLLTTSLAAILTRQAFVFYRLVYTARVRFDLLRSIRESMFVRYLGTKLSYFEQESTGAVVNDMISASEISVTGIFLAISILGFVMVIAVYLAVLITVSLWMTLSAVAVFAVVGLALRRLISKSGDVGLNIRKANERLGAYLVERLKSLRLVRLAGTEEPEKAAIERLTCEQRDHFQAQARRRAEVNVAIEPLVLAFGLLLLYLGVTRFALMIEQIGLFLVIVLRLLPVVKEAMVNWQTVAVSWPSVAAVSKRFAAIESAQERFNGTRSLDRIEKHIRFQNVGFSYSTAKGARQALTNISIEIPAHKLTALVGPSGSGKSTLVDLLPRLREPQEGQILIDGIPITEFSIASLRQAIAFVPQAPQLFDDTIEHHIRYGNANATPSQIRTAAKLAGAAEFIETLPNGYDTRIGEHGVLLSGGQRQRLDIARALVRSSQLLILDEPTSNLDADAEELFRRTLVRIRDKAKITVLLIAHRLSSIAVVDNIIVLEHGNVIGVGTHAELLKQRGWYAQAIAKQQGDARHTLLQDTVL